MSLFTDRQLLVIGAIGVVGVAVVVWRGKQAVEKAVKEDLNPTSDKNVAYRSVNAVGEALTGDKNWTFGGWLYDLTHKDYNPNE